MPIYEDSRYRDALVLRVEGADGKVRPAIYSMIAPSVGRRTFQTYIWREGDRLDLMAHQIYGDARMWWAIADLNPEYLYPDEILPGSVVRLPVV